MKRANIMLGFMGVAVLGTLVPARLCALSITPGRTEIVTEPGKKMNSVITVMNDEKQPLQITMSSRDWFVYPANKDIRLKDWLTLHGPDVFVLKPGDSRKVKISVKTPKTAQGELVAMVSFRYITENAASMVTPMISVSVYDTVAGTEKLTGEIRALAIHAWQGKIQLGMSARATGNVHIRPAGSMKVFKATGEKVVDCSIDEGDPSYPGVERGYMCKPFPLTLEPGDYKIQGDLHYRDIAMTKAQALTVSPKGEFTLNDVVVDSATVKAEAKP